MPETVCVEHSGCIAEIQNLKNETKDQWKEIGKVRDAQNAIMTRLNIILGAILAACAGAFINLILKFI